MQILFFLPNIQSKIFSFDSKMKFEKLGELEDAKMDKNEKVKIK